MAKILVATEKPFAAVAVKGIRGGSGRRWHGTGSFGEIYREGAIAGCG